MAHHAKKSPSGSKRWGTCPGSIREVAKAGIIEEDNQYTADGTAAHKLLELCLLAKGTSKSVNKDHPAAEAVDETLDYIRTFMTSKAVLIVEKPVYIPIIKDTGTPDVVIWDPASGYLHVFDYKNGQGYAVEAKENSQLRLYGWGYACHPKLQGKIKKFMFHICQPRAQHYDGPMRCDEVTPQAMAVWAVEWQHKADTCDLPDAPLVPTAEGCKWCPVRHQCPALRKQAVEAALGDFAAFLDHAKPLPEPTVPNDLADLRRAMAAAPLVELWIKAVKEAIAKRTLAGDATGFKFVHGKSNRQWKDEERVVAVFKKLGIPEDEYAPRKLVGIGKGEKLIPAAKRAKVMTALCHKPDGAPTLAPADDPRSPVSNAKIDFAEELDHD
jgi:hypothetical protein